jgi:hypothetical protein
VLISEFRLRGSGGGADEFVEVYNNTNSSITVATSDGSDGWALDASQSDGVTRITAAVIPVGTVIPSHAHYLLAAQGYSLKARATADMYYTPGPAQTDIADNAGLALYATSNRANFSAGNRFDAVGFTGAPAVDREGAGLPAIPVADVDFSYVRTMKSDSGGLPKDTGDNVLGLQAGVGYRAGGRHASATRGAGSRESGFRDSAQCAVPRVVS